MVRYFVKSFLEVHIYDIYLLSSRAFVQISITFRSCKTVDLPDIKPYCLLEKSWFTFMCCTMWDLIILSMHLH